jgi:hypothetical protein
LEETTGDDEDSPSLCSSKYSEYLYRIYSLPPGVLLIIVTKVSREESEERSMY